MVALGQLQGRSPGMIEFRKRRFFPERRPRQPLRWVIWAILLLLFVVFVLFMKLFR